MAVVVGSALRKVKNNFLATSYVDMAFVDMAFVVAFVDTALDSLAFVDHNSMVLHIVDCALLAYDAMALHIAQNAQVIHVVRMTKFQFL